MSYEKFVAAGADVVNGRVYLNRKMVGQWSGNAFVVMPEGEEWLAAEDVPFIEKPVAPPAAKKAAKVVKTAEKPAPADPTVDLLDGLDDLTN